MENRLSYSHVRFDNGGALTFAINWGKDADTVEYNVSACSPSDSFSKKKGRMVATNRFNHPRSVNLSVPVPTDNATWRGVKDAILTDFIEFVNEHGSRQKTEEHVPNAQWVKSTAPVFRQAE